MYINISYKKGVIKYKQPMQLKHKQTFFSENITFENVIVPTYKI